VLLEAGCGGGFSAEYLEGRYAEYHGVDYSEKLIEYAKTKHSADNVHFYCQNIKDFKAPDNINAILMIGVLHHMDDIPMAMNMMFDMLVPGGILIANEPHPANPLISASRAIRKRVDSSYSADQKELSVTELEVLFADAGFEDIRMQPQRVFSTPFAEVAAGPQFFTTPLSRLAYTLDRTVESLPPRVATPLSWNVIASGRRPLKG